MVLHSLWQGGVIMLSRVGVSERARAAPPPEPPSCLHRFSSRGSVCPSNLAVPRTQLRSCRKLRRCFHQMGTCLPATTVSPASLTDVPEESAAPDDAAALPKTPARPTDEKVALSSPAPVEPARNGPAGRARCGSPVLSFWVWGAQRDELWCCAGSIQAWHRSRHGWKLAIAPQQLRCAFRPALLRVSRLVRSPMVCGCWRPVVLFPLQLSHEAGCRAGRGAAGA